MKGEGNKEIEKILEVIRKSGRPITPVEAAQQSGVNKNTARWCCLKLLSQGKIERVDTGQYKFKRS